MGAFGGGFLGGAVGGAFVELVLDDSPFSQGLSSAEAKLRGFSGKAGQSMTGFQKVSQVAMAGAAVAVGAFVFQAIKQYSALNESINKSNQIFRSASQTVEDFAASAEKIGIARQQALEAAASFGALFHTIGETDSASAAMSIRMVKLAADMASFNNVDPSDMLDRLRSGLAGQARPLRVFGVFLSDAAVKAEAMKIGISDGTVALTDAQKVLARYNLILEQTKRQQGDFARTVGVSLPNQLRVLNASFKNFEADAGKGLEPIILGIVKAGMVLLPILGAMARDLPILLAIFLGYKALQFLPAMLFGVARGLAAVGAAGAADSLLGAASSMEALAVAAKSVSLPLALLTVGTILLIKHSQALEAEQRASIGVIQKYGSSSVQAAHAIVTLHEATADQFHRTLQADQATGRLHDTLDNLSIGIAQTTNAYEHMIGPLTAATKALQAETGSIRKNIDAMLAQRALTDALAGGILGLVSSAKQAHDANVSLSQAQKKVNQDIANGKKGTKQYAADLAAFHDAQFNALQGQLQFHAALTSYAQQLRGPVDKAQKQVTKDLNDIAAGGKAAATAHARLAADTAALTAAQHGLAPAQQKAIALLEAMGIKAGLTKKQVDTLIAGVIGLGNHIDGLHDKDVNIGVHYNYTYQYGQRQPGGGKGPQAHGGIFRGFAGGATFMDRSGPFQAGEGGYYTPLGTGMEMVGSRGVAPLTPDVFRSIGQALGKYLLPHLNGGGGVHIHGDVYGYDDFCRKVRQANYSTMRGRVR